MSTFAQEWLKEDKHIGYQEGKLEGEHEAKISVAKNMLEDGFNDDVVKKLTGLPNQDLVKLMKNH